MWEGYRKNYIRPWGLRAEPEEDKAFILMEFCNCDLRKFMDSRKTPLSEPEAYIIFITIAKTLWGY